MTNMIRHTGILRSGDRCAVVFMQLPEDPGFALVTILDSLPLAVGDFVHDVLESQDGQSTAILAEALSRKLIAPNVNLLDELHNRGLLRRVSVDDVFMTPTPARSIPLREILEHMTTAMPVPDFEEGETIEDRRNNFQINQDAQRAEQVRRQALTLIAEADDLLFMSNQKRARAYEVDPTLGKAPEMEIKDPLAPPAE